MKPNKLTKVLHDKGKVADFYDINSGARRSLILMYRQSGTGTRLSLLKRHHHEFSPALGVDQTVSSNVYWIMLNGLML